VRSEADRAVGKRKGNRGKSRTRQGDDKDGVGSGGGKKGGEGKKKVRGGNRCW